MAKEIQPSTPIQPIGWVRNTDLRKAIQQTTLSLLWKSEAKKETWCTSCWRLTKNPSSICDDCL